jgi:hypothetical protein
MPGLDPGIHAFPPPDIWNRGTLPDRVDGRVKPGHDHA